MAIDTIAASNASVVEAFYPGQSGAQAISDVLFGDFNPCGKLDQTIYAKRFATEVKWWETRLRPVPGSSLGRTHMFYEGVPLYPFGHGLSYTSFSLRWAARGNLSVTLDLDSPHFVSDFAQRSFALEVTNTGKRFGRETVMAFWVPHAAPDQLKQQLFNFSGHWLAPGASALVTVQLPPPVELASITADGDRVLHPGRFTVRLSRGHGEVLNASVVLTGSPKLLRRWPRQWSAGSQMALDWCVEQGLDVTPHAEREPAKQWRYSAANGSLMHATSGLCLSGGSEQAYLEPCSSDRRQRWSFSGGALSTFGVPRGPWYLGGPPGSDPRNFTTMWTRLRVPLRLTKDESWHWHYSSGEGIVKLLNSPPLVEEPAGPVDRRLCLTAQSNVEDVE